MTTYALPEDVDYAIKLWNLKLTGLEISNMNNDFHGTTCIIKRVARPFTLGAMVSETGARAYFHYDNVAYGWEKFELPFCPVCLSRDVETHDDDSIECRDCGY